MAWITGAVKYLIVGGTTSNFHSFVNSFDLFAKHFYNLGMYNIHSLKFSSGQETTNLSNNYNNHKKIASIKDTINMEMF